MRQKLFEKNVYCIEWPMCVEQLAQHRTFLNELDYPA